MSNMSICSFHLPWLLVLPCAGPDAPCTFCTRPPPPGAQAVIMGFLELKRFQGWKETGTSGFLNAFPFDPAGGRQG